MNMQTTILILTILNTLAILCIFFKKDLSFYLTFSKNTTDYDKKLLSWQIILWKRLTYYSATGIFTLNIPAVLNQKKLILQDEIAHLIKDKRNTSYNLHAKFSWLKTWKEVCEFQRNYSIVNKGLVDKLVKEFVEKRANAQTS